MFGGGVAALLFLFLMFVMIVVNVTALELLDDYYDAPPQVINDIKMFVSLINLTILALSVCFCT